MEIKNYKHLLLLSFFGFGTLFFYIWFINSLYFEGFVAWSQSNLALYFGVLFSLKIIGIVWPPLPGGLLTIGSIPVLGWQSAYMADFLGSLFGSVIAYFLARKYGLEFVKKIFDEEMVAKFTTIRIKEKREIESIFLLRFFGGTIVELICYGAGLLKVGFKNYFLATILSHMTIGIPAFYLVRNILTGRGIVINIVFISLLVLIFFKLRDRYFEYN